MCLSVMIVLWLWLLVIYVSVCLWKRKGVSSITDWTFLPLYESTEDVICHFERIWAICLCTWLWSSVVVCCLIWWQCVTVWDGKLSLPQTQDMVDFQCHNWGETHKFQVNKDWYIYRLHNPTCTHTCWCWCCNTNALLKKQKKHPGKLKDDLTTKVWNQNLNSKCLKIVKIWRLHPVLLYFCFLTKRTEKSVSSAINSSTFSHDFWIRSLLPFEHSGTVGVQPEAMDFTNFTNIKTCSDLFYLYFPAIPSRYHKGRKGGVYTCIPLSYQLKRRIGAWIQFQWKFQMDQIRGASWYVQKFIIHYQLLLLPTIF